MLKNDSNSFIGILSNIECKKARILETKGKNTLHKLLLVEDILTGLSPKYSGGFTTHFFTHPTKNNPPKTLEKNPKKLTLKNYPKKLFQKIILKNCSKNIFQNKNKN